MTAAEAAITLNEAFKADPGCIESLMYVRRSCNDLLADHPHVGVTAYEGSPPRFTLGFIGLLNGLLTASGSDDVVAVMVTEDANQNLIGFTTRQKDQI